MTGNSTWRLVTGATGLLGRFVVQRLLSEGHAVRVLLRPSSASAVIDSLAEAEAPLETVRGDLSDPNSLKGITTGVSHVYHCAARLGDWGPWSEFEEGIVHTTRNLVKECGDSQVERFVHVSSVAAYGHIKAQPPWTESQPLGQHLWLWDHYARAKMLAEAEARKLGRKVTIVRPTWIYGPGDRTILPRIVRTLRQGRVVLLGSGDNRLNLVHVEDVAAGVVAAGDSPEAAGQSFNLCSAGEITQREFFDLLADALREQRVQKSVPVWLASRFGFLCECLGRLRNSPHPPRVTRHGISLLTRPPHFSSARAESVLRWRPTRTAREGLLESIRSLQANDAGPHSGQPT